MIFPNSEKGETTDNKKFSTFNENSSPVFKIYESMKSQSTYVQYHLTL